MTQDPAPKQMTLLYANIGAEEARDAKRAAPGLLRLVSLWHGLFPRGTGVELPIQTFASGAKLPPSLGDESAMVSSRPRTPRVGPGEPGHLDHRPIGDLFAGLEGLVPWYPDERAAARAREIGLPLATPSPRIVSSLHDKAFCARFAAAGSAASTVPGASPTEPHPPNVSAQRAATATTEEPFTRWVHVLDPDVLRAPDARDRIDALLESWPPPLHDRFVLKPRFGTSGRGRVQGSGGRMGDVASRGLRRLADRGGALLEPWVDRVVDLSGQYWVEPDGQVSCLGTTRQVLGENGIYLGNRGFLESTAGGGLAVASGHPLDRRFRADCARLMETVAAAGFHGPCGIDGFVYRDVAGREQLRSLVEFNARFTVGIVALGWLARVLGTLGEAADGGEWWFTLAPAYASRLLGTEGAPTDGDRWRVVPLGQEPGDATLGCRIP